MTPDTFHDFFVASAGVSGALIGLLFVASSLAPERTIAGDAPAKAQEAAAQAFMVLSNTLFIALAALIPGYNLGGMAVIVAVGGVMGTVIFAIRTFVHQKLESDVLGFRWYVQRIAMTGVFCFQGFVGMSLLRNPDSVNLYSYLAFISLAFYAVGVGRAWALLGGRRHDLTEAMKMIREERHHADVRRQGESGQNKP